MEYTTYFIEDEQLHRLRIERDDMPESPRECWDNIGTMICFYRGWQLGDKHDYADPYDFLYKLMEENSHKTYEEIYEMSVKEMLTYLSRKGYYFLPLAVYEHSGITMWAGSKWNHFDAQWDCSDVGWIYVTKEKILKEGCSIKGKRKYLKCNEKNWRKIADGVLREEVKTYDQYLMGNVYGYYDDIYNPEDDDFEDYESCWGFYSDKWDEELAREIADCNVTDKPFISEEEKEIFMNEAKIMVQANTLIAI